MQVAGAGQTAGGCLPGPSHFSRVAERLAAQRRAQASPLSRGFGESLLMSRNMTGRYASADALFNGPEPIFAENR